MKAFSGRSLKDITVEAAVEGILDADDIRIHPDTLRDQADLAERQGNAQLAANLRRAAELCALQDAELLRMYEALRPGRSTSEELLAVQAELEKRGATTCAALVEQAHQTYMRRGLLR